MRHVLKSICLCMLTVILPGNLSCSVFALSEGGEGNAPISDPGWPAGTSEIFNHKGRTAWWTGPEFGGGEWHSECKGDEAALNEVLKLFAKIEGPKKRLVVLDGIGYSFWLDPYGLKRGDRKTKIDWSFTVWQTDRWKMQKNLPPGKSAIPNDQTVPIATITVNTAGLRWSEIQVPHGIEVLDHRLQSHGFKLVDGRVIEGKVTAGLGKPLQAKIRVEEIIQKTASQYSFEWQVLTTIETDKEGHWVIKNFGDKQCRLVVQCDGYLSRIAGHVHYDRQPGWEFMATVLSPPGSVKGRVVDEEGKPLADVSVAMRDLVTFEGDRYDEVDGRAVITGSDGSFHFEKVPHGKGRLTALATDFYFLGLGQPVIVPSGSIELQMLKAGSIVVQVEFSRDRGVREFFADLTPEGGENVGLWSEVGRYGDSAKIDDKNMAKFDGVPPGRYVLKVRPNPNSDAQRIKEHRVELKGSVETTVVVKQDVPAE